MSHSDSPRHWELDEIVNRNIASYWPRRNQLFGVLPAAKSTDFSRDFLFPGDKLVHLSDYKMKGFPENNFRYPRIPYAMRDHYLERKLGTQNQQNVYGHAHHHHIDEGKPDLWDSTAMDIDMSEIRQWKDLQRRNAADEEFRRKMERHKVLRLLQEEVAAEREKYLAAKERLAAIENEKTNLLPPIRSSSPSFRPQYNPQPMAASEPMNSGPFPLPPIRQSWHTPREIPPPAITPTQQWVPDYYPEEQEYDYGRSYSPQPTQQQHYQHVQHTPREPPKEQVVEQTQTEPPTNSNNQQQVSIYPATTSVRLATFNSSSLSIDHKKRYLAELKQAAEARRERWRKEREESRRPFVDTVTLLGADRPRYMPLNPAFHAKATDVTRPGMFLQFD